MINDIIKIANFMGEAFLHIWPYLMSSAAMTGITPQEQKGLKAPTMVARRIAVIGLASKARLIYLEAPDIFTATARGIVTNR